MNDEKDLTNVSGINWSFFLLIDPIQTLDVANQRVNPKIMRANLDGSSVEILVSDDLISPVGIALDTANGKMYFTDRFANNVKRANLDGSNVEIVVKDTEYPVDLLIDFVRRLIYWTSRDPGGVLRADLEGREIDGTTLTPIVTGLSNPIGITMDREKKKLYYTEVIISPPSGYIWESDMDGSNARKIVATPLPLGFSTQPNSMQVEATRWRVGADAPVILAELGYSKKEIERLVATRVVGQTEFLPVK